MQRLPAILIATVLSALVPIAAYADPQGDTVKTSRSPYKPGRQINSDAATNADAALSATAPESDGKPVKHAQPRYKPGRQIEGHASAGDVSPAPAQDESGNPFKSSRARYKPGRHVEDEE